MNRLHYGTPDFTLVCHRFCHSLPQRQKDPSTTLRATGVTPGPPAPPLPAAPASLPPKAAAPRGCRASTLGSGRWLLSALRPCFKSNVERPRHPDGYLVAFERRQRPSAISKAPSASARSIIHA